MRSCVRGPADCFARVWIASQSWKLTSTCSIASRRLRLIYLPSATLPATEGAIVADFIRGARAYRCRRGPPGGSILRVLGSGIPDGPGWETQYKRMKVGWAAALARLKVYVEKQMDARGGDAPGTR